MPRFYTALQMVLSVATQISQPSCFPTLMSARKWLAWFWASQRLDPHFANSGSH